MKSGKTVTIEQYIANTQQEQAIKNLIKNIDSDNISIAQYDWIKRSRVYASGYFRVTFTDADGTIKSFKIVVTRKALISSETNCIIGYHYNATKVVKRKRRFWY